MRGPDTGVRIFFMQLSNESFAHSFIHELIHLLIKLFFMIYLFIFDHYFILKVAYLFLELFSH